MSIGVSCLQQIEPAPQHSVPQQSSPPPHAVTVHSGVTQFPLSQTCAGVHVVPQAPQLCGSFTSLTQAPPQHESPRPQLHPPAEPPSPPSPALPPLPL